MGARPIALLNALRFGDPSHAKTLFVDGGVVAGIGGVWRLRWRADGGGSASFTPRQRQQPGHNAMAVEVSPRRITISTPAAGIGNPGGSTWGVNTGRDGVHGATMASAAFSAR
jgi:phosphoribosylformylglycinamidine synthase